MEVNTNEEERCAVSVYISDESAVVDVTTDVGNRGKGGGDVGGVVYG